MICHCSTSVSQPACEISTLVLAQTVSIPTNCRELTPSAPDEQLPVAESEKLQGIRLNGQVPGLAEISKATSRLAELNLLNATSSNNWAIARNAAAVTTCWPATVAMGR